MAKFVHDTASLHIVRLISLHSKFRKRKRKLNAVGFIKLIVTIQVVYMLIIHPTLQVLEIIKTTH